MIDKKINKKNDYIAAKRITQIENIVIDGVNITTADQIEFMNLFKNYDNKENIYNVLEQVPESIKKINEYLI